MFIGELIADTDLKYGIKISEEDNKFFGLLTSIDSDYKVLNSIGSVMISNKFEKAWIQLDEISERYNIIEGYIAGPAETIEEANDIARKVLEGSP